MREIKFRAWDEDYMIYSDVAEEDYVWTLGQNGISLDFFDDAQAKIAGGEIVEFEGYVQTNATMMQFIGIYDNNGKEIYEGDIVVDDLDRGDQLIYVVKWDDENAGFDFVNDDIGAYRYSDLFDGAWIIGNVYDNPDLLERDLNG